MRYGELLQADGKSLNPMTSVAGQSESLPMAEQSPSFSRHVGTARNCSQGRDGASVLAQSEPHVGQRPSRGLPARHLDALWWQRRLGALLVRFPYASSIAALLHPLAMCSGRGTVFGIWK